VHDREGEAAAGLQRSADRGDRGVEVVDIGEPEIAGRHIEAGV